MTQTNMFEYLYDPVKINKHVRIIELFAGYGSQALALKYLGVDYESYKICEWNYKSCNAYKRIHFGNDNTDYSKDLTKEEIVDYLYGKGISADWNKPMERMQITRLKEDKLREVYNDIKSTHNLVDISKVKGTDLEIVDKKNNFYIMTYSFPCQDLSLRGKRAGMDKGSETRSSLLWQVDRILHELSEINALPDVLLMENVIQVHSERNIENFRHWIAQLERLGYQNYWQDLKGTDYGIPQIRNRCFMVSTMNGYYEFPEPVPLNLKLKDLLENNVDEKYYISEKALEFYNKNNSKQAEKGNGYRFEPKTEDEADIAFNITTRAGGRMTDNFIKGKLCDEFIEKGLVEENDVIKHSYTNSRMNGRPAVESHNISPTLDTRPDTLGVVVKGNYTPSKHNASVVVDEDGLAPTVRENHGTVTAVIRKGSLFENEYGSQAGRIYDPNGAALTLNTGEGGYRMPLVEVEDENIRD